MIWLNPTPSFRWSFRKGDAGTDVAALQINLGVAIDGSFGRKTKKAVKRFQNSHGLLVDGVAGLVTQQALCVERSTPAARFYSLPVGMAKSIMAAESNFAVAAVARHPSDAGLDVGAYQRSSGAGLGSQVFYLAAYDVEAAADYSAQRLREAHDAVATPVASPYYTELANENRDRFRWQMAVLSHNWPYAAHWIPRRGHIYDDPIRDDVFASWIYSASGGRLRTPREWVVSYVTRSTQHVRW